MVVMQIQTKIRVNLSAGSLLLVGTMMMILGCSGSGGSSFSTPPPQKETQATLSFAQAGPLTESVHRTLSNVATGGSGSGIISYSSSDTSVAKVSSSGLVTPVSLGSVTITATKAEDDTYSAATERYQLTFVVKDYPFLAWISSNSHPSFLEFGAFAEGFSLITSPSESCKDSGCPDRTKELVGDSNISFPNTNIKVTGEGYE